MEQFRIIRYHNPSHYEELQNPLKSRSSAAHIVEAPNTSSHVQAYTLDEYQGQFDELKQALKASGFDTSLSRVSRERKHLSECIKTSRRSRYVALLRTRRS